MIDSVFTIRARCFCCRSTCAGLTKPQLIKLERCWNQCRFI